MPSLDRPVSPQSSPRVASNDAPKDAMDIPQNCSMLDADMPSFLGHHKDQCISLKHTTKAENLRSDTFKKSVSSHVKPLEVSTKTRRIIKLPSQVSSEKPSGAHNKPPSK